MDFQTINFEYDAAIARKVLQEFQNTARLENAFALDEPVESAGWSFAKMFLSGELVEKIYENEKQAIDKSKGKKFEDKFVSWLGLQLKEKGCRASIKLASEMSNPGL